MSDTPSPPFAENKPTPSAKSFASEANASGSDANKGSTYGQIFKSTAIIGGSSVIDIGLRIVRVKLMAVLLGPSGIGLFGLFNSVESLTRTVGGLGTNLSGTREIAEAIGAQNPRRIAVTVKTLRRAALVLGSFGMVLLAIFSKPVARLTFGNDEYSGGILLMSLALLFSTVSEAQLALIRGMRRIADLAKLSILAAFFGTLFSLILVYFLRERGVALSILSVAASGLVTSWWYARKVKVEPVRVTLPELSAGTATLLQLGFLLMLSALLPTASGYVIRIMVQRTLGIDAAGYYQAGWALSFLYVNFILQAMGMDFYPRLTAASKDNARANQMMNEQAEVGLLFAGPGVIGTLTFAPIIIHLFYSARFEPTVELLRWNCLGMIVQVASWPLATLQLAKGRGFLFFCTQAIAHTTYALLCLLGIQLWGLKGTSIAFCGMIAVQCLISYAVAYRLSGFRWSATNRRTGALLFSLIGIVFVCWHALPFWAALTVGIIITLLTSFYCVRSLCSLLPMGKMPPLLHKVLALGLRLSSKPKVGIG